MVIRENAIRGHNFAEFLELLSQFKRGDVDGIRVRLGRLQVKVFIKLFLCCDVVLKCFVDLSTEWPWGSTLCSRKSKGSFFMH